MRQDESRARRVALGVLGLMLVIFIVLSAFSFLGSRPQVTPDSVTFGPYGAVAGKRVFQAYNCMGCHTIVGNGAYLGPDLTREYRKAGPAWLAAFLSSPGTWPTAMALRVQLQDSTIVADTRTATLEAYLAAYPGAKERVERRGGGSSYMPNLPFTKDEIGKLIAFLKYTSELNTEGWPPTPIVNGLANRRASRGHEAAAVAGTPPAGGAQPAVPLPNAASTPAPTASADPAAEGAQLARDLGCTACHSPAEETLVGPAWGELYDSKVELSDGSTIEADEAYITESIVSPDAKVVAGFPAGVMPGTYGTLLTEAQRKAIVAYIRSLGKK